VNEESRESETHLGREWQMIQDVRV